MLFYLHHPASIQHWSVTPETFCTPTWTEDHFVNWLTLNLPSFKQKCWCSHFYRISNVCKITIPVGRHSSSMSFNGQSEENQGGHAALTKGWYDCRMTCVGDLCAYWDWGFLLVNFEIWKCCRPYPTSWKLRIAKKQNKKKHAAQLVLSAFSMFMFILLLFFLSQHPKQAIHQGFLWAESWLFISLK